MASDGSNREKHFKALREHFTSSSNPENSGGFSVAGEMKYGRFFCLASFLLGFSGNRRFSQVFGLLRMVVFDDEGNMVERFAEIDTHASLEGTYRSRRVRFFS